MSLLNDCFAKWRFSISTVDHISKKTAITITPKTNVIIDVNKSYLCGEYGIIAVKGHVTANISNQSIFDIDIPANMKESGSVWMMAVGSEWDVTDVKYMYLGNKTINARINSGQYFHAYFPFMLDR